MYQYEITYLIDPQLDEEARSQLDGSVDEKIGELAGAVSHSSPSLRRRLFYPIQKTGSAYLRTIQLELDPAHVDSLSQFLRKHAGVLRVSILNTPRREELTPDLLEKYSQRKPSDRDKGRRTPAAAPKKVTMEQVEKGIEEALTEEVK